ncbi:MAG TPA: L-histidine N(alpha)-methyltransferase [Candidatus Saccharimonadales bacterium]|nr:L-histidine N(alpha)-methyltransferase [Candidatus Saccharimonadales bacterium]
MKTDYSLEWFQERAFKSLKKIKEGQWDYSDPSLIYVPDEEEKYETVQQSGSRYHELITEPEKKYLEQIAPIVANALPNDFEYIDLGPGNAHKEQYIFDALKALGKKFKYIPVDIDKKYLDLAARHAERQGIEVSDAQLLFEELPYRLPASHTPRFVSIGMTFTNYAPDTILPLLKKIAGQSGYVLTNSQIRERLDMAAVTDVYQDEVYALLETKIRLLGLRPSDLEKQWCDDGIRAWFKIKNVSQDLSKLGVRAGDEFLAYYFFRPTIKSLSESFSRHFDSFKLLDINAAFVAGLLFT